MKYLFTFFIYITFSYSLLAQSDTLIFEGLQSPLEKRVILTEEHFKKNVLIIEGDSIYNYFSDYELSKTIETNKYKVKVINNLDSIYSFIKNRIRGVIVLEPKSESVKN